MSRDLTLAEMIEANRVYRQRLAEFVHLARACFLPFLDPAQADVVRRAEDALERFQ